MIINRISPSLYINYPKINTEKKVSYQTLQRDIFVKNQVAFAGKNIDFDVVKKLTEHLAKRPYSKKHAKAVCTSEAYEKAKGITGEIPESWTEKIKDIKNFDKENFCERLGDIFTLDRHWADIDVLTDNLRKLFKDHGIISDENQLTTDFIGKGFFGRNFRISIGDGHDKVVKEFKRTFRYHNNHGNFSEQNLGEHFKKYSGKDTEMVPYYYGDTKNGILITRFISKDMPEPNGKIDLEDLGTAYDDAYARNYVGKWIVDFGGIITINNLVGNPKAQSIFREFKHADKSQDLLKLFESKLTKLSPKDVKDYNDTLIGLTHSIRFLPKDAQMEMYNTMHSFGMRDVDIAILEESGRFPMFSDPDALFESIAKTDDINVKKAISRNIKNFSSPLKDTIFEEYSANETNQSIKKYLARNINQYYKNIGNRIDIFDNLAQDADAYANIALINAMKYISESKVEPRFEKMFETGDMITKSALARNIEMFNEKPELLKKWLEKFFESDDFRIKRALAESVVYLPEKFQVPVFEALLPVKDNNTKEFLAEALISIKGYYRHKDWLIKILDGGDNTIRRVLATHIPEIKNPQVKQEWTKLILDGADSSVRKIIAENN